MQTEKLLEHLPDKCPKCHHRHFSDLFYVAAAFSNDSAVSIPEHLSSTCRGCGYRMMVKCKDAVDEPA